MENLKDQMTLSLGIEEPTLSVRDLIVRGEIEQPTTTRRKPKPTPTYERALVDGADCAFRRKCGRKSELLVMLATQGQAYVMDERTGRRHALTSARLNSFVKDAHGDALTPPWSSVPLFTPAMVLDNPTRGSCASDWHGKAEYRVFLGKLPPHIGRDDANAAHGTRRREPAPLYLDHELSDDVDERTRLLV